MQLYGFLAFLDSPIETSRWLRVFGICIGLCRMHEQEVREIILVSFFHLFELFFVIFYSVEIDVVAGGKAMVKRVTAVFFFVEQDTSVRTINKPIVCSILFFNRCYRDNTPFFKLNFSCFIAFYRLQNVGRKL